MKRTLTAGAACLVLSLAAVGTFAADAKDAKGTAGAAARQPATRPATRPTTRAARAAARPPAPKPTLTGLNPTTTQPTAGTPDNTPPAGFTALFNGKDLAGWKGLLKPPLDNPYNRAKLSPEELAKAQAEADENMRQHWKVQDGALVFDGKGRSLATVKDYGDFEMWVDWKILPKGDSGLYLRGTPQVQIWDPAASPQNAVGSGGLFNNQNHPRDPLVLADKPIGEWNTFYLRMVGDKVTIYLNGKLVVDHVPLENYWARQSKLGEQPLFPTGQIELQNHGNTLWFKNIYLKELPR